MTETAMAAVDRQDPTRLLLIESHAGLRADLVRAIEAMGYDVECHADLDAARPVLDARPPALIVADPEAPGVAGWLSTRGSERRPGVLLIGRGDAAGFAATASPETRWLSKPFPVGLLESSILESLEVGRLRRSTAGLDPILCSRDPLLQARLERARCWALGVVVMNLEGELGSGRRALARAIHAWSPRSGEPLVRLEPESLAGAAEREAIDDAVRRADGGTLVLVEPPAWSSCARETLRLALREAADGPSGGPRLLTVGREPLHEADASQLAPELRYRLEGLRLRLPAFRERVVDQPDLVQASLRRVARELGRGTPTLPPAALRRLAAEGFPGNRVGLESRLRSVLLRAGPDDAAVARLLEGETDPPASEPAIARSLDLKTLERDAIVRALAHWDGNRTRASASLGISVRTLRNKIREYGLR